MDARKKVLMLITMALLALLVMSLSAAAADCGSGNLPAGSYRQTCTNCAVNGGNLTASCRKIKNSYNQENW